MPGVFAAVHQVGHDRAVAGHEGGAVAGEVGLFAQRIDRQQALVGASGDPRGPGCWGPARRRAGRPIRPSRVRRSIRPRRPRRRVPGPGRTILFSDAASRTLPVGLAGELTQTSRTRDRVAASSSSRSSAATCSAPGEGGPDVVGGVRDGGADDDVARLEAEQERQPGHEFLGPDRGHHVLRVQPGDAAAAAEPVRDRFPQRRGAVHRGVAGGVRRSRGAPPGPAPGVSSTGVPMERLAVPPGCSAARARYGAMASHG